MIVTKKAISRRTVLRGIGAAVSLAAARRDDSGADRLAEHAGQSRPPSGASSITRTASCTRTGCRRASAPISSSRACSRRSSRSAIASIVITGLADRQAEALGDGGGDHSRASGSYLTGVHVKKSDTIVAELGVDGPDRGERLRARDAAVVAAAHRRQQQPGRVVRRRATAARTATRCRG